MSEKKLGVLLVNLGTPTEPTPSAVRQFLKEFLSDRRVVDLPRLIWLPILYGIILLFRPSKVAKNYQKIWTENGSPLMVYSRNQVQALEAALSDDEEWECKVELGMTYGNPSIPSGLNELRAWGAQKIVVLPLYPQYSTTTTASVTDQLEKVKGDFDIELNVVKDYHDSPDYISALAESLSDVDFSKRKLVLSFHGIPKRYVINGDPYESQCEITAKLLAKQLGLSDEQWEMAYQSRVGTEEWLKPYFDERMEQLAAEGTKSVSVICPGFAVDCLETLEEIAMENKDIFLLNGGEDYQYVDALNARGSHIEMMKALVFNALKQ